MQNTYMKARSEENLVNNCRDRSSGEEVPAINKLHMFSPQLLCLCKTPLLSDIIIVEKTNVFKLEANRGGAELGSFFESQSKILPIQNSINLKRYVCFPKYCPKVNTYNIFSDSLCRKLYYVWFCFYACYVPMTQMSSFQESTQFQFAY